LYPWAISAGDAVCLPGPTAAIAGVHRLATSKRYRARLANPNPGSIMSLRALVAGFAAAVIMAASAMAASSPAPSHHAAAAGAASNRAEIEKIVHDYLLAHPEILVDMTNALQAKQEAEDNKARTTALAQVGMAALLDPKISYVTGPTNAKVT